MSDRLQQIININAPLLKQRTQIIRQRAGNAALTCVPTLHCAKRDVEIAGKSGLPAKPVQGFANSRELVAGHRCGSARRRDSVLMRYGSVCSGIEAASVAWAPLGWSAAFVSEIDKFPCAVLAHRFPDVPLHGDFTTIEDNQYEPIDLLVGGTPCQSFSIAGLRGGLDDDRGNLALEYLRLAQRLRPRWLVWENVPGVLSSGGGRDFGSILGGLVECGYGFAYRVLDAQYVRVDGFARAVPQRRRRVFVVGYSGDWRRAAAVLFERESLSGHPAPSRKARERIADSVTVGANQRSGFPGDSVEDVAAVPGWPAEVSPTVNTKYGDKMGLEDQHALNGAGMFVPDVVGALTARGPDGLGRTQIDANQIICASDGQSHSQAVAYSIMPMNSGKDYKARETDVSQPIMAGGPVGGNQGGDYVASAYDLRGREGGAELEGPHDTANIRAASGGSSRSYVAAAAVRRLTPTECERLQGFPDGWTAIPWRGKDADACPDGPRYKALGNSMAVNVMRWIGQRIAMVDSL
jgi:DNA (cytosine-5)-methyltransferase 1